MTDFCFVCGDDLDVLFNVPRCRRACRKQRAHVFPSFWSVYAGGPPTIVGMAPGRTVDDLVKLADCVVAFDDGAAPTEVLVVKNLTWDATVGRVVPVSAADGKLLHLGGTWAGDELARGLGHKRFAALRRA